MARNRPQEVVLVDDNYNNIVKEDGNCSVTPFL